MNCSVSCRSICGADSVHRIAGLHFEPGTRVVVIGGGTYFKTETSKEIAPLQEQIYQKLKERYPLAVISFSPPETVFEKLFVTGEADIVAELYAAIRTGHPAPVLCVDWSKHSGRRQEYLLQVLLSKTN